MRGGGWDERIGLSVCLDLDREGYRRDSCPMHTCNTVSHTRLDQGFEGLECRTQKDGQGEEEGSAATCGEGHGMRHDERREAGQGQHHRADASPIHTAHGSAGAWLDRQT